MIPGDARESPLDTGRPLPAAVLGAAVVLMLLLHSSHGTPFDWDDHGQYLSHARAVVEGRPYGDIGFIYTWYNNHIGPLSEPPGLPLLIAPLLALSPEGLGTVRLLLGLCVAILLWQAWRFSIPVVGERAALVVALLLLAALSTRHVTDGVLSDVPFAVAIWAVILAADHEGPFSRRRLLAMAAGGMLAFSLRMAALSLFPALVIFALLRPRSEWASFAAVGLAWIASSALVLVGMSAGAALGSEAMRGGEQFLRDVALNGVAIRSGVMAMFTYPFGVNVADDLFHVITIVLALVGAWDLVRRRPGRFACVFAIAYVAMLLVVPARASRYWWALAPLQLLAMVHGFLLITRWLQWRRGLAIGAVAATTLVAVAAIRSTRELATPLFARPEVTAFVQWMQRQTPADSLSVSFFSPRLLTWETRIPAMGGFAAPPGETVTELRAKGVDYLVIGSYGTKPAQDAAFRGAVRQYPEAFSKVRDFGVLSVYRVNQ